MGQLEDIERLRKKRNRQAKPQAFGDFPVGFGHLFRLGLFGKKPSRQAWLTAGRRICGTGFR